MVKLLRAPTRVVINPVSDSRRWDGFEPRNDDIIIATYRKCGTTWTQRIVDLLVHQSPDVRPFGDISPWLDATFFNTIEEDLATLRAQAHRRYIKSHLPLDALPLWDTVKYIHVGRDGRDATLSWQNHRQGFSPEFVERIRARAIELAAQSGRPSSPPPPRPEDPREYLRQWMDELEAAPDDGETGDPTFFGFEATFWRERKRPNLLLVHYNDLITDLESEMRRISDFLEIETPGSLMPKLVEAARFETMKKGGDALFPRLTIAFDRGADRFLNKGRSGRWREYLTREDARRYEAIARKRASAGLVAWIERGRLGAGDPRDAVS